MTDRQQPEQAHIEHVCMCGDRSKPGKHDVLACMTPAEQAQPQVCASPGCGHPQDDHGRLTKHGTGEQDHNGPCLVGQEDLEPDDLCACKQFVPAEPPAAPRDKSPCPCDNYAGGISQRHTCPSHAPDSAPPAKGKCWASVTGEACIGSEDVAGINKCEDNGCQLYAGAAPPMCAETPAPLDSAHTRPMTAREYTYVEAQKLYRDRWPTMDMKRDRTESDIVGWVQDVVNQHAAHRTAALEQELREMRDNGLSLELVRGLEERATRMEEERDAAEQRITNLEAELDGGKYLSDAGQEAQIDDLLGLLRYQPITDAPKTGEHILAAIEGGIGFGTCGGKQQQWQGVVHWWDAPGEEGWYLSSGSSDDPIQPTHFTLLRRITGELDGNP